MRIRRRDGRRGNSQQATSGRQAQAVAPLGPSEEAVAAIRRAEEAAAARTAAEEADRAECDAARRRAADLLAAASARAAELAEQRRRAVRAAVDAEIEREHATAAAETGRLRRAARDRHDLAVDLAVALVLTGKEPPCSSR